MIEPIRTILTIWESCDKAHKILAIALIASTAINATLFVPLVGCGICSMGRCCKDYDDRYNVYERAVKRTMQDSLIAIPSFSEWGKEAVQE